MSNNVDDAKKELEQNKIYQALLKRLAFLEKENEELKEIASKQRGANQDTSSEDISPQNQQQSKKFLKIVDLQTFEDAKNPVCSFCRKGMTDEVNLIKLFLCERGCGDDFQRLFSKMRSMVKQ